MGAKAKHDLAPLVRTAFVRALEIKEAEGKTFSEMMKDAIDDHGILAVLDRLSKYTVRESKIDTVKRIPRDVSELTDDELGQLESLALALLGGDGDEESETGEKEPTSVH